MNNVTVDLTTESPYVEPDTALYRFRRKLTYGTVLSIIRRFARTKPQLSVLEVGTGSGFFMSFIESEFPEARVVGIEYNPRLVDLTQQRTRRARILRGNAEQISLPGERFDIVVSLQVIEHLYHPERMLDSVRELLQPTGRFILTTPNLGCLSARLMRERWHGYRSDHVSLKNREGWVDLVERHGFRTIYSGSTFFSGIPILNRMPLGVLNWALLLVLGALRWNQGESFVGVFERSSSTEPDK